MDDTWVKIRKQEVKALTEHTEHIHDADINIKFTWEDVRGDSLTFLDCAVHTEEDRTLNTEVFRNLKHTDQYLLFNTHHPLEQAGGHQNLKSIGLRPCQHKIRGKEKEQRHIREKLKTYCFPKWTFVKTSQRSRADREVETRKWNPLWEHLKIQEDLQ